MAFVQVGCYSEALGMQVVFWAIIPQASRTQIGQKTMTRNGPPPVLYLLHGLSDDHSVWLRRTSIDRYAEEAGLAVIMPAVDRSLYADMKNGPAYWTFLVDELPGLVHQFFNVSRKPAETFVAGLSMGGYGAFKLALSHPDRFAAAASLSGLLDITRPIDNDSAYLRDLQLCFGGQSVIKGSQNDLCVLAKRFSRFRGKKPALYQCCGTEDFLHGHNRSFLAMARANKIEILYEEGPGTHEWGYWDRQIERVIRWLPIRKEKVATRRPPGKPARD